MGKIRQSMAVTTVGLGCMLTPTAAQAQQFDPTQQAVQQSQNNSSFSPDVCAATGLIGLGGLAALGMAAKRRGSHVEKEHGRRADESNEWYAPDRDHRR